MLCLKCTPIQGTIDSGPRLTEVDEVMTSSAPSLTAVDGDDVNRSKT